MYSHLHNDRFFFSGKKKLQCVPNGVEKSRTGAFRSRDQTLNIFFQAKKKTIIMQMRVPVTGSKGHRFEGNNSAQNLQVEGNLKFRWKVFD